MALQDASRFNNWLPWMDTDWFPQDTAHLFFSSLWIQNFSFFSFFLLLFFFLIIADLQCCASFCGTARWPQPHVCIHPFSPAVFHHVLSQELGCRCLCCTVGPHCLSLTDTSSLSIWHQETSAMCPFPLVWWLVKYLLHVIDHLLFLFRGRPLDTWLFSSGLLI